MLISRLLIYRISSFFFIFTKISISLKHYSQLFSQRFAMSDGSRNFRPIGGMDVRLPPRRLRRADEEEFFGGDAEDWTTMVNELENDSEADEDYVEWARSKLSRVVAKESMGEVVDEGMVDPSEGQGGTSGKKKGKRGKRSCSADVSKTLPKKDDDEGGGSSKGRKPRMRVIPGQVIQL